MKFHSEKAWFSTTLLTFGQVSSFWLRQYTAHLLKEDAFETAPCKNAYEANESLPIDEARGFFEKVRDVIDHYHIKHQNVWNYDESWVSPEDKAPRVMCLIGRGHCLQRTKVTPERISH